MSNITYDLFEPVGFQDEMHAEDYAQIQPYIDTLDAFARSSNISIYVIDYYKHNFLYVSHNPLFLNHLTIDEVKKMGYLYYEKFVPEKDLLLLKEINKAGFAFYKQIPIEDRLKYTISYDFHIIVNDNPKMQSLINHKLTPMKLSTNGYIWLAMCVVTLSSQSEPGAIKIKKVDSPLEFIYNRESGKWKEKEILKLSDREIEVIRLSAQGLSNQEIADSLFLDINTVKFHKKNIFSLMEVRNIAEAIAYAANNKLL